MRAAGAKVVITPTNVEPEKTTAYTRGTFLRGYGGKKEELQNLVESAAPQVIANQLMKDPFMLDTRHAHKHRAKSWIV